MSVLPLYSERFGVQRFCFAPGANVDNPVLGRSGIGVGNGFIRPTVNGLVSRSVKKHWQARVLGLMQVSALLTGRMASKFV